MQGIPAIFTVILLTTTSTQGVPLQKSLEKCSNNGGITGIYNCAAFRTLNTLEIFEKEQNLQLLPGVTLMNEINSRSARNLDEDPLPADPNKRASILTERLLNTTARLFSRKSLKITLPETTAVNIARALDEGRGKMKKMMGPFMLGLGAKMLTMVPIMMGGLALLTTKALVVGKVAFVISLILFVQYFFSGRMTIGPYSPYWYGSYSGAGTNYGTTYGTNTLGWGSSQIPYGPYARSMDVGGDNQENSTTDQIPYSRHN